MNGLFAFFSPGPLEILILLVLVGVPLVALGLALFVRQLQNNPAASNPNLTPCPDCRHYVSRQAPACPKCGRPLLPQQNP